MDMCMLCMFLMIEHTHGLCVYVYVLYVVGDRTQINMCILCMLPVTRHTNDYVHVMYVCHLNFATPTL